MCGLLLYSLRHSILVILYPFQLIIPCIVTFKLHNGHIYELCLDHVQESKKSKLLLGKNNKDDEEEVKKTQEQQKDKFNLSHDEYYTAKNSEYL